MTTEEHLREIGEKIDGLKARIDQLFVELTARNAMRVAPVAGDIPSFNGGMIFVKGDYVITGTSVKTPNLLEIKGGGI